MNGAASSHEAMVFYAALRLPDPEQRRQYLARACADDPALQLRLEELLSAQLDAEQFFSEGFSALTSLTHEALAAGDVPTPGPALSDEQVGARIGRYKLLQKIGEGGCGAVYMAEQEEPVRRRVALKVIKLGMDTRAVIARFEAERQALAMMDHPNIARVFDAGATNTGRPFFVMELVPGFKITNYCDENRLDLDHRLHLFIQVCRAIQHAHQKGIIHRDIKPSNILVTLQDGGPVLKVIDFGIAKATEPILTDHTPFTTYAHFMGTPAYMSPEQAELGGHDIDTRSDIYSLGVLLYELLAGAPPFDSKELARCGLDEMRRILREREPLRPSNRLHTLDWHQLTQTAKHRRVEPLKLITLVKGDLDWIVIKALEKDRRRRYETANGLAMDVERYLNNEPVVARPPSRSYRFQKMVRRHRGVFITIGAVAAALIMGLGTSTWLLFEERAARERAVAAEQKQVQLRQEAELARANEANLRRRAEAREQLTQAALLVSQGRFAEADRAIQSLAPARPNLESAAVLRSVGEWHAVQNQWRQAADRLLALLQVDVLDGWDVSTLDCLRCGPALIEAGDTNRYDQFRRAAIARYAGTDCPAADRIVKISLLLPAGQEVLTALKPLADMTAKSITQAESQGDVFQAAWRSLAMALWEFRLGNDAEAIQWSRKSLAYPEFNAPRSAAVHLILAMSYQRLNEVAKAQTELAEGRRLLEPKFKTGLDLGNPVQGFWFDWEFARILFNEAAHLMNPPAATGSATQLSDSDRTRASE